MSPVSSSPSFAIPPAVKRHRAMFGWPLRGVEAACRNSRHHLGQPGANGDEVWFGRAGWHPSRHMSAGPRSSKTSHHNTPASTSPSSRRTSSKALASSAYCSSWAHSFRAKSKVWRIVNKPKHPRNNYFTHFPLLTSFVHHAN